MPQYNGVWTLQAQAQALTNQQWVTDPNFKNTTLLLQADGAANTAQNNLFLDTSPNQFTITRNGNTTQGSFTPFSSTGWSNVFTTTSTSLTTPAVLGLRQDQGDWTLEFFIYLNAMPSVTAIAACMGTYSSALNFDFGVTSDGKLQYEAGSGAWSASATYTSATGIISANQWIHVAMVRSSGSLFMYANGVRVLNQPTATFGSGASNLFYIGNFFNTSYALNGYISNFRFVQGTPLYTGATLTIPTSALTPVTNTQLLTCQSNQFIDTNTQVTAKTLTVNSTPSVQAFSPFAPQYQWTPTVIGGSAYFDGTGDYLVSAGTVNWSTYTNLTVELWTYPTNLTGSSTTLQAFVGTSHAQNDGYTFIYTYNDGKIAVGINGTNEIVSAAGAIKANTWSHVAVVKAGSTTTIYVNGVSVASNTTGVWSNNSATVYVANTNTQLFTGYLSGVRLVLGSAVYTGAFTPPTTPPTAITNTSLLLNYTNAGIYDGKMANNLETVGNAQVSTSVVKYGSGSIYFDGSGDYLVSPAGQNYEIGSGDFTIECWVYGVVFSSSNGGSGIFGKGNTSSLSGEVYVLQCNNGTLGFYAFASANNYTSPVASGPFNLQTNTWNHVAVTKANGITRVFVNGISGTSSSLAYTVATGGSFYVGTQPYSPTDTTRELNGYVDDLRITKGVARYIANFTPPQQALPRQ